MRKSVLITRRGLVRGAAILACALVVPALGGCGGINEQSARSAIESGLEEDLSRLTSLDSETASTLFASDFTTQLVEAGVDPADVYGPMLENLSYTIADIDVDGGSQTATVSLTVSNEDVPTAMANFSSALSDYLYAKATGAATSATVSADGASAASASFATDDESRRYIADMGEMLRSALSDSSLSTVTTSVQLHYALRNGTWSLQNKSDLVRAILGGLDPDDVSNLALSASSGADAATAISTSASFASEGVATAVADSAATDASTSASSARAA
ncbi:MAG: hypothetical protein SOI26_08365 [Coriobacteriales bacterium]|jgi:hypothetical protein